MNFCRRQPGCILLALSLLVVSCGFKREPRKATIIIPPPPPPPELQALPEPPLLVEASSPTTQIGLSIPALKPPVTSAARRGGSGTRRTGNAPANHNVGEEENLTEGLEENLSTPAAPALVPALQPILGPQETNERTRRIDSYLAKARSNLRQAERNRNRRQAAGLIAQVRTFVEQAEEARKTDLARAENLAERAEVLSRQLNR
ncbi:MAG: hypothetical protein OHK0021_04930 [Bryobacter sp.]